MEAIGKLVNGWRMRLDLGRYGTNYEQRATVALMGLGANLPKTRFTRRPTSMPRANRCPARIDT